MANGHSKNIRELVDGDSLVTIDPNNGELVTTEFIGYLHADSNLKSIFLKIELENQQILEVTQDHLLYEKDKGYILAQKLAIGDKLLTPDNNTSIIVSIGVEGIEGIWSPLTSHGSLIVNGAYVSSYAKIENFELAQNAFVFYRLFKKLPQVGQYITRLDEDGILTYAKYLIKLDDILFGFHTK